MIQDMVSGLYDLFIKKEVKKVNKSIKIRSIPTNQQELLIFKPIGCSRLTCNLALNRFNELYH
ncbi:helix-turn-helix domain-containing protein [Clostridium sp. LP20]|uniref:helix-turn-helix domain-containing protein n=1 Tax=Clostridium sp. LP20 TaxID=3418665 RepID=UPI003EE80880